MDLLQDSSHFLTASRREGGQLYSKLFYYYVYHNKKEILKLSIQSQTKTARCYLFSSGDTDLISALSTDEDFLTSVFRQPPGSTPLPSLPSLSQHSLPSQSHLLPGAFPTSSLAQTSDASEALDSDPSDIDPSLSSKRGDGQGSLLFCLTKKKKLSFR